jgi:hypothetical protein
MFSQIINTYWWIIPLLFLIAFLKSPFTKKSFLKGVYGEFLINSATNFFLDKHTYKLFKNVTLPTENGTTQIDHVIVSRYGIFVIETKNMKGWIFGSPQQKTWTQKIYRHTSQFQNPLHQNYKHTQTLLSVLELESDKVFSVVVFVGDSTFKTAMPDNVVNNAKGYIRFIKSKKQSILNDSEVLNICTKLQSSRLKPSIRTHINHVKHVKTIVAKKKRQVEDVNSHPKCCSKPMILRTARSGNNQGKQFWGCSDYPKCKMIKQMAVQ